LTCFSISQKEKQLFLIHYFKNSTSEVELPDRWVKNCRILCRCQLEIFGTMLFPANRKCHKWRRPKLNCKGSEERLETFKWNSWWKKHMWQDHLATLTHVGEMLLTSKMLILFSLAERDRGCLQQ
jgi:hypothetical protein